LADRLVPNEAYRGDAAIGATRPGWSDTVR